MSTQLDSFLVTQLTHLEFLLNDLFSLFGFFGLFGVFLSVLFSVLFGVFLSVLFSVLFGVFLGVFGVMFMENLFRFTFAVFSGSVDLNLDFLGNSLNVFNCSLSQFKTSNNNSVSNVSNSSQSDQDSLLDNWLFGLLKDFLQSDDSLEDSVSSSMNSFVSNNLSLHGFDDLSSLQNSDHVLLGFLKRHLFDFLNSLFHVLGNLSLGLGNSYSLSGKVFS